MRGALCLMVSVGIGAGCLLSCGPRQEVRYSDSGSTDDRSRRPALDDVQLDCRLTRNSFIGEAATIFGPTCNRDPLPLAYDTFDIGAAAGFNDARQYMMVASSICFCQQMPCSEKTLEKNAQRVRDLEDNQTKSEREGAYRVSQVLSGHGCLNAAVGVELYNTGHSCGYQSSYR